jgi:MoaA/NifB/PqqE/SkfB family radical SAM enzyme
MTVDEDAYQERKLRSNPKGFSFYIDVFSYCNLRCPSCLVGNKFGSVGEWPRGLMSPALLGRILDKALSECLVSSVSLYNWTEPLLHPNIAELIRTVKARGLPCHISSNLNVLREPEALLASGLDWLRISLSGYTQPVYQIGHRGGDIETVKTNMRRLAAAKTATGAVTCVEVFYHRYRHNEAEIQPMAALSQELGFEFASMLAYITLVEKIIAVAEGRQSHEDKEILSNLIIPLDRALGITSKIHRTNCSLIDDMITIDVAGNVMLCCGSSMSRANTIGGFLDLTLDEIQRRRQEMSLCGPCLKLGIPDYFAGEVLLSAQ